MIVKYNDLKCNVMPKGSCLIVITDHHVEMATEEYSATFVWTSYLPARVLRLMRYWKLEISPRTQRCVTEVSPISEEKRPVACSTLADLRTNQKSVIM